MFYTLSCKKNGFLYNRVAKSTSIDMENWSESKMLTPEDYLWNFCSPGNVLKYGDEFVLCFSSYPMPYSYHERCAANDDARLFIMKSRDLEVWSEPIKINIHGVNDGRKIDPYIIEDKDEAGKYHLLFKQDGRICMATSNDITDWAFSYAITRGENPCVIVENDEYNLIYSLDNTGIGKMVSKDLKNWSDKGIIDFCGKAPDWASGRLTAGFVMKLPNSDSRALFFHGSVLGELPETHGNASIGIVFS